MEYAVFDWDNTVREGYTLYSWVDFLCEKGCFAPKNIEKINEIKQSYYAGLISHDDFANIACDYYVNAIKGMGISVYNCLLNDFISRDKHSFYPFTKQLFKTIDGLGIKIVIISGAPERIIEKYKDDFNIDKIYAFSELFSIEGICLGDVSYNYGHDKEIVINKLFDDFGKYPLVGFGDSASDYPLFAASKYSFRVVEDTPKDDILIQGLRYLNKKSNSKELDEELIRVLT